MSRWEACRWCGRTMPARLLQHMRGVPVCPACGYRLGARPDRAEVWRWIALIAAVLAAAATVWLGPCAGTVIAR